MDKTALFGTIAGSQPMKIVMTPSRLFVFAVLLFCAATSFAAIVGPAGYTNSFTTNQVPADWAGFNRAGSGGDVYDIDSDVNSNVTATAASLQLISDANNPPTANATSQWSSAGLYLSLRATGNRYSALMGKFVNNTGTNATQIFLGYTLTIGAGTTQEDANKGHRAYYSLTGATNSWTNIPAFNTTSNSGTFNFATNVTVDWTNGGNLYVLFVDDNGTTGTDNANEIDDFSLLVTGGLPPFFTVRLASPSNNVVFVSGTPITASASVAYGTPPYTVEFFTNRGAGNTTFASAGTTTTDPYTTVLGTPAAGTYNLYAVVTDSATATTNSLTNTFFVADPITFSLSTPTNNASVPNNVSVIGTATVSGGRAPYSVQFYLDNVANGVPVTSTPYERDFGLLFVGDHTIKAVVTDASGWVSNSAVTTIHITGPLGVAMTPTNGANFIFGQSIVLAATPGGGNAPYAVRFYTNNSPLNWISYAPFSTNLGVIAAGSYTTFVYAVDSTISAEQRAYSATNVFAVLPNPLIATLTNPTNNQTGVAGQPFVLAATASVIAPLTISNVEFFVDGVSVGVDATAPFTATITTATAVSRTVYAVATDNLGRKSYTSTNTVNFIIDPLANNNFANRIPLGTPASITGQNVGATTEAGAGEPINQGFSRWGATMWYSWVAPVTGAATIDTFGSDFNTFLSIYTGNAVNALTVVGRNDNAPGQTAVSLITFSATAGTEYQIQLGGAQGFQPNAQPATGNFRLNVTMPPAVTIISPTNNSVFRTGTNVTVSANALPAAGTIVKVDFYRGATVLATISNAPYTFVFSNALPGTNSLYAVATDSLGQIGSSANVNLAFFDEGVTIVSPADGAAFLTTNNITVNAVALLGSGAITNIEFFIDNVKFGQDATAPFSVSWTNVTPGSHRLTAVGQSDAGTIYNAQPVYFAVAQSLVASNSIWKFVDDGTDQGTAWIATNFDDNAWLSGPAPLGYGDSNGRQPLTTNSFGLDSNNKFITTYYRQAFVAPNTTYSNVILNIQRDDGAVVYLNGVELTRFNMPTGAVNYLTYAAINAQDDGGTTFTYSVNPALVHPGTNFFAVSIHQDTNNSSDIWFELDLRGVPVINRNQSPAISLVSPTNGTSIIAPAGLFLTVDASDPDGYVTKVELFDGPTKITESVLFPFELNWPDVPVGIHSLTLVATDNGGQTAASQPSTLVVFNSDRQPLVQITSPANGAIMEGPTNLTISAIAYSPGTITSVQFLTNGASAGIDGSAPYSIVWPSSFLTNTLVAIVSDDNGGLGTSAPVTVVITIPPTNYDAPFIVGQTPVAGSTVSNLTSITVRFSERVIGVDAADFEINGLSATGLVVNSSSNYTFQFPQPPYGTVDIRWEETHHITDIGYPDNLPFNDDGLGAQWTYKLIDTVAPTIVSRTPAASSLVTNLTQIAVTFSEPVTGVDAADLLVNGTPAFAVSGSGASYVFDVVQPNSGNINVTWSLSPNIFDTATNAFNRGTGGWTFTLDSRSALVQSNANWLFIKALDEPSSPLSLWRGITFDDSTWSNAPAPFYFGDAYNGPGNPGTLLSDMRSNYTTIYLREKFVVANAGAVSNLFLGLQIDDGFVAWINGVEVARFNVGAGDLPFNASATQSLAEPGGNGPFGYTNYSLPNPTNYLVSGTNVLAVQALNQNVTNNDFGFNAQLYTFLSVVGLVPPRISSITPTAGVIFYLTNLTVVFTEPVTNIDPTDLFVNGVPAASVSSPTNTTFIFSFAQPAYGSVDITWAADHGIVDLDATPHAFNATAAAARPHYELVNPSTPVIASQTPQADATINYLTNIAVKFSEFVQGVNASDLLLNGVPATDVSGGGPDYIFTFPQPPYGTVNITWVTNHGIKDFDVPAVDFQPIVPGNTWSYNLVDPIPPLFLTRGPYLQSGGWTNMTIRWRSDVASDAIVYFGTNQSAMTNYIYLQITNTEHIVTINGLTPSTRYYYKVGSSFRIIGTGTDYYFDTSPLPGTIRPVRAWVLGDPGTATQNQRNVRDAFYQFAATNGEPDLWLMLGDNAYNSGTDTEYQAAVFNMYPTVLRNKVLWPAIGNHESNQSYDTALDFAYLHIFSTPLLGEAGGVPSGNIKYYSFDYANIHFVCIDSMTSTRTSTSAMANWLRADLASTMQDWVVAYWHHPPYTRGNHNSDAETDLIEMRQNILPIIESYGVDLVLCGHSHAWERSYLLNAHYGLSSTLTSSNKIDGGDGRLDGTGAYRKNAVGQGVVYVVAGSAGQITGGQLNHPAHFLSLNELGSLVLDVNSNRMDVMMLATNGVSRDHFTLVKAPIYPMTIDSVVNVSQSQSVLLTFNAYSNVTYTIQGKDSLTNTWRALQVVNAAPTNRVIQMSTTNLYEASFFRLRSP